MSDEPKHTSGPWEWKVADSGDGWIEALDLRQSGGGCNQVLTVTDVWTGYAECGQMLRIEVEAANAALITTAPDLLAALVRVSRSPWLPQPQCPECLAMHDHGDKHKPECLVGNAIAKAEGGAL